MNVCRAQDRSPQCLATVYFSWLVFQRSPISFLPVSEEQGDAFKFLMRHIGGLNGNFKFRER